MKQYPRMTNSTNMPFGDECIAFVKYDGSNFRAEWRRGKGFVKFGSRNHLIDETDLQLGQAVELFKCFYEKRLNDFLEESSFDQITLFFEYVGKDSFAGTHTDDDAMHLVLIDAFFGDEQMDPWDFAVTFEDITFIAPIYYEDEFTEDFVEKVRSDVDLKEGVVVKTGKWMCKIKTNAYKARLKETYGNNWNNFWE